MNLAEIEMLIKERRYDEALTECEKLLDEQIVNKQDVLRKRAYAFSRSGDHLNAVKDRQTVIDSGEALISDFYLGAFDALYVDQFLKSKKWFHAVLRLGKEQDSSWFESATYFYLSYVEMQLGNYSIAIDYLDNAVRIEADLSMPVPGGVMCDHTTLRKEIRRRISDRSTG